jgi:hypothetical protein
LIRLLFLIFFFSCVYIYIYILGMWPCVATDIKMSTMQIKNTQQNLFNTTIFLKLRHHISRMTWN